MCLAFWANVLVADIAVEHVGGGNNLVVCRKGLLAAEAECRLVGHGTDRCGGELVVLENTVMILGLDNDFSDFTVASSFLNSLPALDAEGDTLWVAFSEVAEVEIVLQVDQLSTNGPSLDLGHATLQVFEIEDLPDSNEHLSYWSLLLVGSFVSKSECPATLGQNPGAVDWPPPSSDVLVLH